MIKLLSNSLRSMHKYAYIFSIAKTNKYDHKSIKRVNSFSTSKFSKNFAFLKYKLG